MKFDQSETDTILAALRYWQRNGLTGGDCAELELAQEHGPELDAGAIDDLCERINFGEAAPPAAGPESDTLEFLVQIDQHEDVVDAHAIRGAIARAIEFTMDNDIARTESLNRDDLGQVSVHYLNPERITVEQIRDELHDRGFGDDEQSIDGADFVQYGGNLYGDLCTELGEPT